MKKSQGISTWILLLLCICLEVNGIQNTHSELLLKLNKLPNISNITPLESNHFAEKYQLFIEQKLEPLELNSATFQQRIILLHAGFDRPTILVTEGYGAQYSLNPNYTEELATLLHANIIFVEYRYFMESTPQPINWDYLTVENSLYDLHNINRTFKNIYTNQWISTGVSKGGQTCMAYRAYFPDDVDFSIPYVAPLNRSTEDGRHEKFISNISTKKARKRITDFQIEVLKRKETLLPLFQEYCKNKGYTFRCPIEEIFDFNVLEYSFAFWQWGTSLEKIPNHKTNDDIIFSHFITICEPSYFAEQTNIYSFFVQAARELGYYGYNTKPFRKYLSIKNSKGYLHKIMLSKELKELKFEKELYNKVRAYLKYNDPKMIFIYGENDPWSASGVQTWLKTKKKKNMHIFIQPEGDHRTRIKTLPTPMQKEILSILEKWINPS